MIHRNLKKQKVVLTQVGYDGLIVGKTSFGMNALKERSGFNHQYLAAGLSLQNNQKHAYLILNKMAMATV